MARTEVMAREHPEADADLAEGHEVLHERRVLFPEDAGDDLHEDQ